MKYVRLCKDCRTDLKRTKYMCDYSGKKSKAGLFRLYRCPKCSGKFAWVDKPNGFGANGAHKEGRSYSIASMLNDPLCTTFTPRKRTLKKREKKMVSKILIIDCQGIGYKSHFAMGGMDAHDTSTHIIFGFLQELRKLAKKHKTNEFILCWDSRNNKRKKMFKAYKKKRHSDMTPEEIHERNVIFAQFKRLRCEILPKLGFQNNYIKPGYEGDDLIATWCQKVNDPKRAVVVSEDEDMYQLLDLADIYKPRQQKFFRRKDFIKKYNITPDRWSDVKALAGCSSDEVPGIAGIGELTACRFLNDELKHTSKKYKDIMSDEGDATYVRNLSLVTLPIDDFKLRPLKRETFLLDNFVDVFEDLRFRSFLKDDEMERWRSLFYLQ